MTILAWVILILYTVALSFITLYCLVQFNLLYHYKRSNRGTPQTSKALHFAALPVPPAAKRDLFTDTWPDDQAEFPFVTVQLPIYNERYVVERLIDHIAAFDYPPDRFEIHILDDSTDETREIIRRKVEEYRAKGLQIDQIRRARRQGFKAGALRDATPRARGEFIAIFDADFLPEPDFLHRTLPCFQDQSVGVVQTRWEHLNENYSLITRLQALQLNVHFTVEQSGRMAGDLLLQFNGTAGVWRKATILDAGGWQADTLTEDLDLSIRAQLNGWKIRYLEQVGSPAELPAEMNSFKSQQFRWMKGGAETAKKMLPAIWRSQLRLDQKIHSTFHLLGSTVFVFVFALGVFSVPLLFLLSELLAFGLTRDMFAGFLIGLLSVIAVYYVGNVQSGLYENQPLWRTILKFIFLFPLFLALSMGLSLHNSMAVLQGYLGRKTAFVRTPKFNIRSLKDSFSKNQYLDYRLSWTTLLEGLLALYFLGGFLAGLYLDNATFLVFHLLLCIGYGSIFYFTIRHLNLK